MLIFLVTFGAFQSEGFQLYVLIFLIWIAYALQSFNNPYQNPEINELESLSLISAGIANLVGIYFHMIKGPTNFKEVFLIFAIGANIYFFLKWAKAILTFQRQNIRQMIKTNRRGTRLYSNVANKFPILIKVLFDRKGQDDSILNNTDPKNHAKIENLTSQQDLLPNQLLTLDDIQKCEEGSNQLIDSNRDLLSSPTNAIKRREEFAMQKRTSAPNEAEQEDDILIIEDLRASADITLNNQE